MLLLVALGLGIGEAKSETDQKVKYMGWDDAQKKLVEMTTPEGVNVTVLEGTETTLGSPGGETWYVTKSEEVTYASTIKLYGNVHIILANGTTMNVGKAESQIEDKGIDGLTNSATLSIYGQKQGDNTTLGELNVFANGEGIIAYNKIYICGGQVTVTTTTEEGLDASQIVIYGGQVTVTSSESAGMYATYLDIYGGQVTATSYLYTTVAIGAIEQIAIYGGQVTATSMGTGIYAQKDIVIYGGQVTATSSGTSSANAICTYQGNIAINGGQVTAATSGTSSANAIYAYQGNIAINGGQVTATASSPSNGIHAKNKLTLGWTNPTDYIFCSSYNEASMETVSGKKFAVYNDNLFMYVIGSASDKTSFSNISSLGNRIYPFEGELVPVGSDKYYAYNLSSGSYKPLNPGVSVYLVTGIAYNQSTKQYEAVLSEAQPGVVSDVPVIFGADKLPNSIALKEDATFSLSATRSENFIACDGAKKVSELLPSGVNFADVYFFGLSGNSFKRVLLGSDDVHPAGTCFLFIPKDDFNNPPSSAPAGVRGIGIETDGTTSLIGNGQLTTDHAASAQWYSLDGRRLDKAPKTKGVYIRNGKKLVIK